MELDKIEKMVRAMPGLSRRGGRKAYLSYPLLREISGKRYVVYMVYLFGEGMPDAFALYGEGDEAPLYLSNGDALRLLSIDPAEFRTAFSENEDATESEAMTPAIMELLKDAIAKEVTDRELYDEYYKKAMTAELSKRRPAYRFFA